MKNKIILLVVVSFTFLACKKEEKQETTDEMKSEMPQEATAASTECYEFVKGKDTISGTFLIQDNTVTGDLKYNLFQKDKNAGTITGTIIGDTLLADYSFISEGITSVRQIVFLRKNKTLTEGFGEIEEKENKMVLKDLKKVNFTSGIVLNEIPCK